MNAGCALGLRYALPHSWESSGFLRGDLGLPQTRSFQPFNPQEVTWTVNIAGVKPLTVALIVTVPGVPGVVYDTPACPDVFVIALVLENVPPAPLSV